MTIRRSVALFLAAALAAVFALPDAAPAQRMDRGFQGGGDKMPGSRGGGGGHGDRGWRGGGGGLVGLGVGIATGVIMSAPPAQGTPQDVQKPAKRQSNASRTPRRGGSGVPPAGERRLVPDEVVVELPNTMPAATVDAVQRRFRLTRLDVQPIPLIGSTFYRFRIPDRSNVPAVVRSLEGDRRVASAQPNYLYTLQQDSTAAGGANTETKTETKTETMPAAKPTSYGDPAQYAVAKMRLQDAHAIAKGGNIKIAVIDSGIDADHPELAGAVAGSFDTLKPPFTPHAHGTAIAALIAGHSRLMGSAPAASILAVRAFDPAASGAEATTFNILKGIDWSVAQRANIINMSFAGPADPAIHRALEAAHKKGVVLIAAAGNAGEKSPPLYPAADPNVIAVTATDATDQLFKGSNRGRHIAVAAPGVDILIAVPNGGYEISTGTSYSAAEVSGIVALALQRKADLTPVAVRNLLLSTAKDLGKTGRDDDFGAGSVDAYRTVTEVPGGQVSDAVPPK
jgi:subtilisin family serine protease